MTAADRSRIPLRGRSGSAALGLALVAVLVLATLVAPSAATAAAPRVTAPPTATEHGPATPLRVTIETMTPAVLPRRGEVTLTGEISNRSDSTWTDLAAYLFVSDEPMTTAAEVAEATATDPALPVGERLVAPGLYDEPRDLAPGETTTYRISVPRRVLPEAHGVYWIGVHVLGTNEDGRVDGADGRARTFVASMPRRGVRTTLSLVVPFRAPVRRDAEGRVARLPSWERLLGERGRLTRVLELVSTAEQSLTLVVDPAILDAARSLAAGNPGFDLTPTLEEEPPSSEAPQAPLTEDPEAVEQGTQDSPPEDVTELSPAARRAADWLTGFVDLAERQSVLSLPYGDLDVAAVLRRDREELYRDAVRLGSSLMADLEVNADPVVAPPRGLLPEVALDGLDPGGVLLLSERAADTDSVAVQLREDTDALLTSEAGWVGGPGPTPPFGALAMRQRILAEAAVHGLSGATAPLVISTPDAWNPGAAWPSASFFAGLELPWLRLVDLSYTRAISSAEPYDGSLFYPRAARRAEVPGANVRASESLARAGGLLAELLTRNDTIDEQAGRSAMLGSSVQARSYPRQARVTTQRITETLRDKLGAVSVESSSLVTMSSETGAFQVTVVNELEEPVAVGIEAESASPDIEIRPPDLVSLGAGQRASVRLSVTSSGQGVHSVRITPTTRSGEPIGQATTVALRSSQVGLVIWLIMGTGGFVFVAAIVARIVRRVRSRGRTGALGPALEEDALR